MSKQHQKKFNKRKKRSFLRFAITVITVFNLVFYQSFTPLTIAKAAGGEQPVEKTEKEAMEEIAEEIAEEKAEEELLKDKIEKAKKAEEEKIKKIKEEVEKKIAEVEKAEKDEAKKIAEELLKDEEAEAEEKAEEDEEKAKNIEKDEAGESGEEKIKEDKDDVEDDTKEISTDGEDLKDDILPSEEEEQEEGNEELVEEVEKFENENEAVVEINSEVNADTGNNKIDGKADEADKADGAEIAEKDEAESAEEEVETEEKTEDLEIGTEETDSGESGEKIDASIEASTDVSIDEDEVAEKSDAEPSEENVEDVLETKEEILEGSENDDDIIIETGEAEGMVNIFNEINSNITGENWEEAIYNLYGDYVGDINLLEQFLELLKKAKEDSENKSIGIDNKNKAVVKNNVDVNANTGNNEIENGNGEANITTGDANAEVNIVNFINQNITGNNWLFSVINVFGNWFGDLIVPGEDLLEIDSPSGYSKVEITNENKADIKNNVNINVDTGENEINSGGDNAGIETGDAVSGVEVVNIANRNTTGNNWFFLMVNNMGSWVGNILNWNEDAGVYNNVFSYNFGTTGGEEYMNGGMLNVHSQNTASVENNVNINVNTGGNIISGKGDANIKTGNAGAWANIFNFVNNNITGNNWLFGIVNIMGSWTGDVVFAYPDLEVAISDGKETVNAGEAVSYTVVYENTGEAAAEGVEVIVSLPEQVAYQSDTSGTALAVSGNNYAWTLPGMEAGEEKSFIVSTVVSAQAENESVLESFAGVKTGTTEKELQNNYSSDQTIALAPETVNTFSLSNINISNSASAPNSSDSDIQTENFNSNGQEQEINPQLEISRESNTNAPIQAGYVAKHEIILENTGDSPIYGIEVEDEIENEKGETVVKYTWKAGDLLAGEKVLVEYEILINGQTSPGMYEYKAVACGYDWNEEKVKSGKAFSEMNIIALAGTYYEYLPEGANGGIIPTAQAAGIAEAGEGAVLGVENAYLALPFWIWLLAALGYLLMINWSLFPKKRRERF